MNRDGFTLVELIVAMMIFMVGVLALASTTGFVGLQLRAADLRTERSLAHQQAMEEIRSKPFDDILTASKGAGAEIGDYTVWWDVNDVQWALKNVAVYTEGPGFRAGYRDPAVVDTITVRISRVVR